MFKSGPFRMGAIIFRLNFEICGRESGRGCRNRWEMNPFKVKQKSNTKIDCLLRRQGGNNKSLTNSEPVIYEEAEEEEEEVVAEGLIDFGASVMMFTAADYNFTWT